VGVNTAHANDTRMDPNVSCFAQRFIGTPYSNVGPAMIGNYAAAERITKFSDEDKGTSLKDWLNDLWIKWENYNWTDEQVARLILECCKGCACAALEAVPSAEQVCLEIVLRCLEGDFYSYAKHTASGLLFNTRIYAHTARPRGSIP